MQVVIIGAGLAGLTLARQLCRQGVSVVLIEREAAVGGLARSFRYENGAIFDIGPHRFHTLDPEVLSFITEVLEDDCIRILRNSQLYLYGKYLPWPIELKSVLALPPALLLGAARDIVW